MLGPNPFVDLDFEIQADAAGNFMCFFNIGIIHIRLKRIRVSQLQWQGLECGHRNRRSSPSPSNQHHRPHRLREGGGGLFKQYIRQLAMANAYYLI